MSARWLPVCLSLSRFAERRELRPQWIARYRAVAALLLKSGSDAPSAPGSQSPSRKAGGRYLGPCASAFSRPGPRLARIEINLQVVQLHGRNFGSESRGARAAIEANGKIPAGAAGQVERLP